MTEELIYLLLKSWDDSDGSGVLVKKDGLDYFRCSSGEPWTEDRDLCGLFMRDPGDSVVISRERAAEILARWEPGWKKVEKARTEGKEPSPRPRR